MRIALADRNSKVEDWTFSPAFDKPMLAVVIIIILWLSQNNFSKK